MKIDIIQCPSCGANLDINLNSKIVECPYCRSQLYVNDLLDKKTNKKTIFEESNETTPFQKKITHKKTVYETTTEKIDINDSRFKDFFEDEEILNKLKNGESVVISHDSHKSKKKVLDIHTPNIDKNKQKSSLTIFIIVLVSIIIILCALKLLSIFINF